MTKGYYKEGKMDVVWEEHNINGQLEGTGTRKEGWEDGVWEWYYENGQLEVKGSYKERKKRWFFRILPRKRSVSFKRSL
jgi:antitoxin component YwqK of YwqJK toxin-antitoxin module